MSQQTRKKAPPKSPLRRLGKVLYIALFCVSLVVVVGYVAMSLFAPAPTVDT